MLCKINNRTVGYHHTFWHSCGTGSKDGIEWIYITGHLSATGKCLFINRSLHQLFCQKHFTGESKGSNSLCQLSAGNDDLCLQRIQDRADPLIRLLRLDQRIKAACTDCSHKYIQGPGFLLHQHRHRCILRQHLKQCTSDPFCISKHLCKGIAVFQIFKSRFVRTVRRCGFQII